MKYDVFISYSRNDMEVAEKLCAALDDAGINYWIDRNIHGSANFLSEITRYIRDCKVVVFIASASSAQSEWTQREILFALKHKKSIVPYRIGDFQFENNDELDFIFMNVQWIESVSEVIIALDKLGCVGVDKSASSAAKRYKVGDFYDDGVKQGVVFEVWDDGLHGKIVSLDQSETELQWCSDEQYDKRIEVGTSSDKDGKANTEMVVSRSDREGYPAFEWCRMKGADWYLPAIEELKLLLLNDSVHDAVNLTLEQHGATKMFCKGEWKWYWSSTEYAKTGECCAWDVRMGNGLTYTNLKHGNYYVRAVATF